MPLRLVLCLLLAAWAFPVFSLPARAQAPEIRAPRVVTPPSMMIPVEGKLAALFPRGLTPGLGFGLNCVQAQAGGTLILHTITGRGPVMPGPTVADGQQPQPSSIFILPSYNPAIVSLKLEGDSAEVIGMLPLTDEDGKPLRGLPPEPEQKDAGREIPLDMALKPLNFDVHGIDPQGVAFDFKHGVFWVADGYRPALLKISPRDGSVLSMLAPGDGLEEYLGTRRPGFGFSGASIGPTGVVYTMMEGPLAVNGVPAFFSRIVEVDPDTGRVRQIPYPMDDETFADPAKVVTGEPVAYADKKLLVLEQGLDKEGKARSLVFAVDITRANNINNVHNDAGQPPEVVTDRVQFQRNIQLPRKTLVLDLQQAGFKGDMAESMTLLADGRTLAFMSGHGFGLEEVVENGAAGADGKLVVDPAAYQLEKDGKLTFQGQPVKTIFGLRPTNDVPRLWLATLPRKVSEY